MDQCGVFKKIEYSEENIVNEGGDLVVLYKELFSEGEKQVILESILRHYEFKQDHPIMMGYKTNPKRKTCQVSESGVLYAYNGSQGESKPFTKTLRKVKERVEMVTNVKYNFALLNLYADGDSSIGEHSDNEKGLVIDGKIASLSLGDTRTFYFRNKNDKDRKISLELESGDLLVMCGTTQKHWKHAVPKRKNKKLRINITFRQVVVE
jgi:alkylated DNA repair dioxygenase AlkB